ncbi:helix-turn-helix domain-containing protein [Devosia nitrariae]|uniref:helix-turn-helix domain-containing protein n=1 Tax=Devosia nitrariae TaxID=2071872 RepID=UPI0024E0EB82|nr:AraC family transcriptional regulator [Devosia nitrariae]
MLHWVEVNGHNREMDFSLKSGEPFASYRTPAGPAALAPVAVLGVGRQRAMRPVVRRRLSSYAMVLIESGSGTLWTEATGKLSVEAPALFWLFPEIEHTYGPSEGEAWQEHWVLFDGNLSRDAWRCGYLAAERPIEPLRGDAVALRLFAQIIEALLADTQESDALAGLAIHELIVRPRRRTAVRGTSTDVAEKIAARLREDIAGQVDFTHLAGAFGLSPATLRRQFLARYGMAPKAFHLQLKLDQAKEMLGMTDIPVSEIAGRLGFEDAYYFSRLFHAREGCPPREFRHRHRRS